MKKVLSILLSSIVMLGLVGCGSSKEIPKNNNTKIEDNKETDSKSNKGIEYITNPFNLNEEKISSETVLLSNYNCKVQLYTLENCRLMLSTNYNKDEKSFSFMGYVYEKDTNIPDAIFVDNTSEINNSNIYAVGLIAGKENSSRDEANPVIAQYKYSKTSDTTAVITNKDNEAIGSVKDEDAKNINDRIEKFKSMIK